MKSFQLEFQWFEFTRMMNIHRRSLSASEMKKHRSLLHFKSVYWLRFDTWNPATFFFLEFLISSIQYVIYSHRCSSYFLSFSVYISLTLGLPDFIFFRSNKSLIRHSSKKYRSMWREKKCQLVLFISLLCVFWKMIQCNIHSI